MPAWPLLHINITNPEPGHQLTCKDCGAAAEPKRVVPAWPALKEKLAPLVELSPSRRTGRYLANVRPARDSSACTSCWLPAWEASTLGTQQVEGVHHIDGHSGVAYLAPVHNY